MSTPAGKKYLIEYAAGTKGDMLTSFLNNTLTDDNISNNTGKTELNSEINKILKFFMNKKDLSLARSEGFDFDKIAHPVLKILEANFDKPNVSKGILKYVLEKYTDNLLFINAHHLNDDSWFDVIKDAGWTIKKISFDKKYYRDIWIESTFKNSFIYGEKHVRDRLDQLITKKFDRYDSWNDEMNHRETWDYEDLYKTFDIFTKDPVFENRDLDKFKYFVEKSWLPDEIEIFGKTWYPADHGYRKNS